MLITDVLEGLPIEVDYTCHESYISLSRGPSEGTGVNSAIMGIKNAY